MDTASQLRARLYRLCIYQSPRSPTARVHVAAGGNIIGKQFPMIAKCRGDGREPPQRVQRAGVAVLWCWACDAFEAPPLITPGASLPPLGLPLYHLGRPFKGYWDTKTTRRTTTWLAARPE